MLLAGKQGWFGSFEAAVPGGEGEGLFVSGAALVGWKGLVAACCYLLQPRCVCLALAVQGDVVSAASNLAGFS